MVRVTGVDGCGSPVALSMQRNDTVLLEYLFLIQRRAQLVLPKGLQCCTTAGSFPPLQAVCQPAFGAEGSSEGSFCDVTLRSVLQKEKEMSFFNRLAVLKLVLQVLGLWFFLGF